MGPLRRRLSRRVVKTPFQECFEYDIPGFRPGESKSAPLPLTKSRLSVSLKHKTKLVDASKLDNKSVNNTPSQIQKKKIPMDKEKEQEEDESDDEEDTKDLRKPREVPRSIKHKTLKTPFVGSDYKRFIAPSNKSKVVRNVASTSKDQKVRAVDNSNFKSDDWQPVVHLEKLDYNESDNKRKISSKDEKIKYTTRSADLVTRLKNALKDPIAEQGEKESESSDNSFSENKLAKELKRSHLTNARAKSDTTKQVVSRSSDCVRQGKRKKESTEVKEERVSKKHSSSDSALEDWPVTSDEETYNDFPFNDIIQSPTDWASPHLSLILDWQNLLQNVTDHLKNSYVSMKGLIEKKNSLILELKRKLELYQENDAYRGLECILRDYDKKEPKNPATVIVNSVLEYSKTNT